jgi:hypothetical protein
MIFANFPIRNIDIYLIVPSEKNENSIDLGIPLINWRLKLNSCTFFRSDIMKHILFLLNVSILIKYFQNSLGGFRFK